MRQWQAAGGSWGQKETLWEEHYYKAEEGAGEGGGQWHGGTVAGKPWHGAKLLLPSIISACSIMPAGSLPIWYQTAGMGMW